MNSVPPTSGVTVGCRSLWWRVGCITRPVATGELCINLSITALSGGCAVYVKHSLGGCIDEFGCLDSLDAVILAVAVVVLFRCGHRPSDSSTRQPHGLYRHPGQPDRAGFRKGSAAQGKDDDVSTRANEVNEAPSEPPDPSRPGAYVHRITPRIN
jgi:hypothetical protein